MNADVFVGGAQTNCCKQKESNNLTMSEVNSISLYLRQATLPPQVSSSVPNSIFGCFGLSLKRALCLFLSNGFPLSLSF